MNHSERTEALDLLYNSPMAMHPPALKSLEAHVAALGVAQCVRRSTGPTGRTAGQVAVLPLYGIITQHENVITQHFGGTSTEKWGQAFDNLIASPQIGAVVIDVDSPGGEVYGIPELADKVFKARGSKPIVAVSNAEMFSAAYWVASAADEVVVTPSGQTGSIGVFSLHVDYSGALEQAGEKPTFISAGERKVWGNPFEPLTEESKAMIQGEVDTYYNQFVAAVAKHRGATSKQVRGGYGQGSLATAKESVTLGLADRVATLDDTIRRWQSGRKSAEREDARAAAEKREAQVQGWEAEARANKPKRPALSPQEREKQLRKWEVEVG